MASKEHVLLTMAVEQFPDLTDAETRLLQAVTAGEAADYRSPKDAENDLQHADTWGVSRTIRAQVLRWLCIDHEARNYIDPKGLHIKLAKIEGKLDLCSTTIPFPLTLLQCSIPMGIDVAFAKTRFLNFEGSACGFFMGNGAVIDGDVFLRNGFKAKGAVELDRAKITGKLDCTDGRFLNRDGDALSADSVDVSKHILLRQGFRAEGKVWLTGATIGGLIDCNAGAFCNSGGMALYADSISVGTHMFLRCDFVAKGLVHLASSKIGGNLDFTRAQFRGEGRYNGLIAQNVEVAGTFFWREVNKTDNTLLDLSSAKVGHLADDESSWPMTGKLDLEDFTYAAIAAGPMDAKTRRRWLERQTFSHLDPLDEESGLSSQQRPFSPKPYQQLAKVLRESGQEADAKRLLILKERARRKYGSLKRKAWCWNWFLDRTMAYGYKPQWLLIGALFFVMLGWGLFEEGNRLNLMIPANTEVYDHYSRTGQVPPSYPAFRSMLYSLDTFVPIINFGQKDYWWPRDSDPTLPVSQPLSLAPSIEGASRPSFRIAAPAWVTSGEFLRTYRLLHIGVGWLLITLGVAGVTGLIRKE